jgi:acyl-CoA synthetase (AMP-forming)/AMP-acid ligase II
MNNNSQSGAFNNVRYEKERSYWLKKLNGDFEISRFPRDFFCSKIVNFNEASMCFSFPNETFSRMKAIGKNSDFALFMIFLAGLNYILKKYSANNDVLTIMPVFKQSTNEEALLNSLLPLRMQLHECKTFKHILKEVKTAVTEANDNQNFPIISLIDLLNIQYADNKLPLLNTIVLFDGIHDRKYLEEYRFDTLFSINRLSDEVLNFNIFYNSLLYREDSIKFIASHLLNFFDIVLKNPDMELDNVDILMQEEKYITLNCSKNKDLKVFDHLGREIASLEWLTHIVCKDNNNHSADVSFYIVDETKKILPTGIEGELYIEGDGLERLGFENASGLEVNNIKPTNKIFRTGYRARRIADGNMELVGRVDQITNIRGSRVNLREVELLLLKNKEIKESAVVFKETKSGNRFICAYLVSDRKLEQTKLKDYLSEHFPDFMIPSRFVLMDKIPLGPDGKPDMINLPEPLEDMDDENKDLFSGEKLVTTLKNIWQKNLGINQISEDDNLFDLGGNSMLAIKVELELEKVGIPLKAADIIFNDTIKDQVAFILKK